MRRAYDDVREAFEPLISKVSVAERDELNYGTDDKSYRAKVKAAYLAELILAYLSVIYSAAQTLPPTPEPPLLDAMELVGRIGDEEHAGIISAFRATGRMHQLVTALALCSKAMVKYEEELKGKFASVTKAMKKSRKRNAKSISIWNISGSG